MLGRCPKCQQARRLRLRPPRRQDLPPAENTGLPSQLFAIVVAIFGFASFALVLALIEQVGSGCGRAATVCACALLRNFATGAVRRPSPHPRHQRTAPT